VLDFGAFFAGPYGARLLSDLGADVIKIEPLEGDPMRAVSGPLRGAMRGKRSIAIDLKSPDGIAIARELIRGADVICHNMRPGVAERIGVGYAQAKAINPSVVYLDMPGWGSTGPKAHLASFAPLPSGLCGLLVASAGKGGVPVQTVTNEDFFNGMCGAMAALMGLLYRDRTGDGVLIESALLNSLLFATSYTVMSPQDEPVFLPELDSGQYGLGALNRLYRTSDDWICLAVLQPRDWNALVAVPGLQDLGMDPRFVEAASREIEGPALTERLEGWFAERSTGQALAALRDAGVPCEQPRRLGNSGFVTDEENVRLGRISVYENETYGAMREIAQVIRFSETPGAERWPAVDVGEQGPEILAELGFSKAQIAELKARNVVNWRERKPQVVGA
jgi:crotonobetainyl-CoA:carnitine CoA-transferase CaiB-like acyl-CoA transferase